MPEMKESPIFSKTYDLLLWINSHTGHFPKSERFRLAKRIEDAAFNFHDAILRATGSAADSNALAQADHELMRLKFLLRLSKDSHLTNQSQYEHCMRMLVEIGRLLGAWMKHFNQSED